MSNTRRTNLPGIIKQERFASSPEFERGLMANLVAKRCSILECAADRELIWFLQLLSHEPVGLRKLAADLTTRFSDRIATDSMRKFGTESRRIYSAEQVRIVRDEMGSGYFPLKGEIGFDGLSAAFLLEDNHEEHRRAREDAKYFPSKYAAADFVKYCHEAAVAGLEKHLLTLCLDPALPVADGAPWYFPTLVSALREFKSEWIAARQSVFVTSIGKKITDALDYGKDSRRMVIIDGVPRIGKSHATKAWCNLNPGRARYVECPCGNDDFTFFRDIAVSLGVSINLKSKAQELRTRVEETLRGGDLALVMDQAHNAWPQSHYRNTMPARINWLMSLVDRGVFVALVTTPQFFRSQQAIEKTTCWTAEQFVGRIGHYEKLPDVLSSDDLAGVSAATLPCGNSDSVNALALYAESSRKFLGGIDAIVSRARFICQRENRQNIEFRDVKRAIRESVVPSDSALADALIEGPKLLRKHSVKVFATPLQSRLQEPSSSLPTEQISRRSMRPEFLGDDKKTELANV